YQDRGRRFSRPMALARRSSRVSGKALPHRRAPAPATARRRPTHYIRCRGSISARNRRDAWVRRERPMLAAALLGQPSLLAGLFLLLPDLASAPLVPLRLARCCGIDTRRD